VFRNQKSIRNVISLSPLPPYIEFSSQILTGEFLLHFVNAFKLGSHAKFG
jgi:hypothetical protein